MSRSRETTLLAATSRVARRTCSASSAKRNRSSVGVEKFHWPEYSVLHRAAVPRSHVRRWASHDHIRAALPGLMTRSSATTAPFFSEPSAEGVPVHRICDPLTIGIGGWPDGMAAGRGRSAPESVRRTGSDPGPITTRLCRQSCRSNCRSRSWRSISALRFDRRRLTKTTAPRTTRATTSATAVASSLPTLSQQEYVAISLELVGTLCLVTKLPRASGPRTRSAMLAHCTESPGRRIHR